MSKDDIIQLAAKGGPLPEDLDPADTFLFLALRALYSQARYTDMSKEQGAKEKNAVLRQYDKMKLWVRVVGEHRRKEREFEIAWETFAKNPTWSNASFLHQAWFNAKLKPVFAPAEEEDQLQGT